MSKTKEQTPASETQARLIDERFSGELYMELYRIAEKMSPDTSFISAGTLVNDAYLRLRKAPALDVQNPSHLKFLTARTMRNVLRDLLRVRGAQSL